MPADTFADADFYRAVPGAHEIDRVKRRKLFVDPGPLFSGGNTPPHLFPDHWRFYKYFAAYHGGGYGYSTKDIDRICRLSYYRRAKAAAEDDAYYNADNVRFHILQYAVRAGIILVGEYAIDHNRTSRYIA